jgi:hypothetical protein
VILLISASQVARITDVSHWHPVLLILYFCRFHYFTSNSLENQLLYLNGSSSGAVLSLYPAPRTLDRSGNNIGCHTWEGATGTYQAKARYAAENFAIHRINNETMHYLVQNTSIVLVPFPGASSFISNCLYVLL